MNKKSIYGAVPVVVILVAWQVLSQSSIVSPLFLPPVSSILYNLYISIFGTSRYALPSNVELTIGRMFLGFFLCIIIGVPMGIAIGSNRKVNKLVEPTIEIFRPLPPVVLIPFFILIFGINEYMFVSYIAFGSVWPVLLNSIDGVKGIEPLFLDMAKSFKINGIKRFLKITLPASSPYIVSGMRVSLLLALLITIAIEMVGGHNGLGWSVIFAQQYSDLQSLYGQIFIIASIGFILNLVFVRLENRFMGWHKNFVKGLKRLA